MIHSSNYKPRIYPIYADASSAEIDRLQELTATTTLNRSKIEEIGRDGIVDWRKTSPAVNVSLRQLEYGNLEFWRKLANVGDAVDTIEWTDFKTSSVDIAGYKTDDSETFLGTVYYPNLRLAGFGVNIGDPQALIERSFSLVGEDEKTLLYGNKYLIFKRGVIASSANDETITLSDPAPAADPDNSGQFLFKVVKVSAGSATLLEPGTGWSYDGAGTLTINGASTAGDTILCWYSASTDISGNDNFVLNDTDVAGISADSCSIYLQSSNYLYRLQSVGIDTTFDRNDVKEIGSEDVVMRGVRDITNRITLGRILEQYTIEEILLGKAGENYGIIDVSKFTSNMDLVIKIYKDNTKKDFLIGYKFFDLAPTGVDAGAPLNDYVTRGVTLECEAGLVTNQESVL